MRKSLAWVLVAVLMLGLVGVGVWIGHVISRPDLEAVVPAAAQSQPDGSVIAGRAPVAHPPAAPHAIPRGAVEERRVSVTVKPRLKLPASPAPGAVVVSPDPVRVDLSLVRMEGGRRVIASSPDGDVVGALDVPIEAAALPTSRPWAAGLSCDPARCQQTPGAWIDRDMGRVRLGAEVARRPAGDLELRARLGWTW